MATELTGAEARAAFDEVVKGLAKQHLRLRFRRKFGTGELMDITMLIRSTVTAPLEKPITNLLQEVPEHVQVFRLVGTDGNITGNARSTPAGMTIGELLAAEETEQALIVKGRRARLLAYYDPTEAHVYVAREVLPDEPVEKAKTKKPRVRAKASAGRATARKVSRPSKTTIRRRK